MSAEVAPCDQMEPGVLAAGLTAPGGGYTGPAKYSDWPPGASKPSKKHLHDEATARG
jgi:hypothetical protein